jgi:hypothetical protein
MTRGLAAELGPRKIRVNAIAPGGVYTEGTHSQGIVGSDFEKAMVARTPLGRFGEPDDIARVAVSWPPTIPLGSPVSDSRHQVGTGEASWHALIARWLDRRFNSSSAIDASARHPYFARQRAACAANSNQSSRNESPQFLEIAAQPPPRQSRGAAQGPRLRDQQDPAALQGASGLNAGARRPVPGRLAWLERVFIVPWRRVRFPV